MARQATKACGNRYYEARMRAAMYNEKFLTRAGAVESLPGVTEDSLKKYELDINRPPNIDFLRVVQDEIVRRKVIDTRLLLASFEKGSAGNIWEIADGGLTLEVGTNVEYATYVHDGHWTNSKGVAQRWVPGYWEGDRFIYDPAAKTGMLLKQKWVKGNPYFDSAIRIYNKIFQASLEVKLEEWLDKYLGG